VDVDRLNAPSAATVASAGSVAVAAATDPHTTLAWLEASLLDGEVSKQTHDAIVNQIEGQSAPATGKQGSGNKKAPVNASSTTAGLLLGSPEFQRK
jgi:hypothetical protein